jgi:hypothetical protein
MTIVFDRPAGREATECTAAVEDDRDDAAFAFMDEADPARAPLFNMVSSQSFASKSSSSLMTRFLLIALPPSIAPLCFASISNGDNGEFFKFASPLRS